MSRASRDPRRESQGRHGERQGCTRKTRYSKIGAQLQASKHGGRIYKCPFCTGWHHTKGEA